MSKKDNARLMGFKVVALREAAGRLDPASPALAQLFREKADYIQSGIDGRGFDAWGVQTWEAKVDALLEAAGILLHEWASNRGS